MHRTAVKKVVLEGVLDANDALGQANRQRFDAAGNFVVNMISSPGAGKTALLEDTLDRTLGKLRIGVLEDDVQTTLDADRLARFHAPIVQVNTDAGFGGECHLDANMVRSGLAELPLPDIDVLVIENVGNLVCPAEFKVCEDVRVMVYAITEGEGKPLKYPLMFRSADLVLVNRPGEVPPQPRRRKPRRRTHPHERRHGPGCLRVVLLAHGAGRRLRDP